MLRKVKKPKVAGWYAFTGLCTQRDLRKQFYETVFEVKEKKRGLRNTVLAVETSSGRWRELDKFEGDWWKIDLPWEGENDGTGTTE